MITFKTFISEGVEDKGIFKAIFLCGSPGAGKSYTIDKISDVYISPKIVNTDLTFEFLAKKAAHDLSNDLDAAEAWEKFGNKSKQITKERLKLFLGGALPLIIDGTSSNPNSLLMRVGVLESLGYDVGMIHINTDLKTAIERVQKRDRKVPEDFIKNVYDETQELAKYYKKKFDFFLTINNSEGELTDNVILEAYKKSKSFFTNEIYNPVGKKHFDMLKHFKEKMLVPGIIDKSELDKKIEVWYKK